MWSPLGCVKCGNSTLTDLAASFYFFLSLLSNLYCTPTLARPPKSRIYLTSVQIYGNLKAGVVYIARNIKIKVARAELDMTQKALAEAVGISRQTMNAIEQGDYNPTIKLCRAICRVLGKTLDELFGEEEEHEISKKQK